MHSTPISISIRSFVAGIFLVLLLVASFGCGDDDPTGPVTAVDISGVVRQAGGGGAEGATIYLGWEPPFFSSVAPIIQDSVLVDGSGFFVFDDLAANSYRVYSGMWDDTGTDFSLVSAFSKPLTVKDKSAGEFTTLTLEKIKLEGIVTGEAFYDDGIEMVPADSADVYLWRYIGAGTNPEGKTLAGPQGGFRLPGVQTGNYTLVAVKQFPSDAPYPMYLSAESKAFFSTGEDRVQVEPLILRDIMVEKPAVYIYPEVAGRFEVGLEFGAGVGLTASIPEYGDSWDVLVDPSGRIDGTWDYLFYEISLRGSPRIPTGWCVARSDLAEELASIATELGLNAAEREDFLTYWLPRLPHRDYYEIHPVLGTDLDAWVRLNVKPAPATVIRFWLFMRGVDAPVDLPAPRIPMVERSGTTVVEWGGAVIP